MIMFIELTAESTGRTIHARADCITLIDDYVNDDEGKQYTRIWLGTSNEEPELCVKETPEEVRRRIKDSELREAKYQTGDKTPRKMEKL